MTQLALENLTLQAGRRTLLAGVGCEIEAGSLTGIIGANGAGKSTLLMAMAGLLPPASGTVTLDGRALKDWPRKQLAQVRAYLPQTAPLHWPISVEDAVGLGRFAHGDVAGAGRAAIQAALVNCDLLALAGRSVTSLSGGERARVHLARLLAQEPRLILADEPASELDPAHQLRAMALLKGAADSGAAVIVVLHDLTAAARWCARLLVLGQGSLLAQGPPAAVLTPELLDTAFGIKAHIGQAGGQSYVVPLSTVSQ